MKPCCLCYVKKYLKTTTLIIEAREFDKFEKPLNNGVVGELEIVGCSVAAQGEKPLVMLSWRN
jgi:hypothetical protein